MHSVLRGDTHICSLFVQQFFLARKGCWRAQSYKHRYHHCRLHVQRRYRARRRHSCHRGRNCRRQELRKSGSALLLILAQAKWPQDSLHNGQHSMLWRRDRCRHGVHYRSHLLQYGTPRSLDRQEAKGSHCHDHAQTDALSVRLILSRFC